MLIRSLLAALLAFSMAEAHTSSVTLYPNSPLIHFHGRWDASQGTWWTGSGFKLYVSDLTSMTVNLGPHTTQPLAAVGLSVDYETFRTVNFSEGVNVLPLSADGHPTLKKKKGAKTLVRVNVEGWQNNRIDLDSIVLNEGAEVHPYIPSKIAFQFIGDSLTAGQYNPMGVDTSWGFLTGEYFKAEHNIQAQPGACLVDQLCWGNYHGVSYEYFRTEDTGYYYTTDHNYTTPWNFARDQPPPTHVIIHIGANDNAYNITSTEFVSTYLTFVSRLRNLYPHQPFFIFTPWGWPSADGSVSYYYPGAYEEVVDQRKHLGDHNIYLVNTTGWVSYADVYPDNTHPTPEGHAKISKLFIAWLEKWDMHPPKAWATPVD